MNCKSQLSRYRSTQKLSNRQTDRAMAIMHPFFLLVLALVMQLLFFLKSSKKKNAFCAEFSSLKLLIAS